MRKLISWNMASLDGYFEAPEHQIDWFAFDEELERYIIDSQRMADTLLFGRRTYEMMASHWPSEEGEVADFMNSIEKVVASRTLQSVSWNNSRLISDDVAAEVARIKEAPGNEIFLFGSADLQATLMQHDLIDEYRVGINPIVLGGGVPLFKELPARHPMKLNESKTFTSGLVVLHYQPA